MFKSFDIEDEKIRCSDVSELQSDFLCETLASAVPSDKREHKPCFVI